MTPASAALTAAVATAVLAAAGTGLVTVCGPADNPRARGSHVRSTPTSGGVAMIAAAALGLLAYAMLAPPTTAPGRLGLVVTAECLAAAGLMGLLGAVDDMLDLRARLKLLIQLSVALVFAAFVAHPDSLPLGALDLPLGHALGAAGTVLWLVVAVNAVNFMDGSNGLAAGSAAIAFFTVAVAGFAAGAPELGSTALIAGAAVAGFLPWNLPGGRIFQGDAGSLFTGFLLAALAVAGSGVDGRGPISIYLVPFALIPLLTDVLLTLIDRARRRQGLADAHRDHLYQLWLIKTGRPHGPLALRVWALTAAYAGVGLWAQGKPFEPTVFLAGVATAVISWVVVRRRLLNSPARA